MTNKPTYSDDMQKRVTASKKLIDRPKMIDAIYTACKRAAITETEVMAALATNSRRAEGRVKRALFVMVAKGMLNQTGKKDEPKYKSRVKPGPLLQIPKKKKAKPKPKPVKPKSDQPTPTQVKRGKILDVLAKIKTEALWRETQEPLSKDEIREKILLMDALAPELVPGGYDPWDWIWRMLDARKTEEAQDVV